MQIIKLFGERNTGTNYLDQLIKLNFDVKQLRGTVPLLPNIPIVKMINKSEAIKDFYFRAFGEKNLGWKHSNIDVDRINKKLAETPNLNILLLVKNPYSFLLSLHKNPYHNYDKKKLSFDDFILCNWSVHERENLNVKRLNPIELWNTKNRSYLKLKEAFPKRVMLLKYEDLVSRPESVINSISNLFKLPLRSTFKNYERSTKNKGKDFNYYAEYYLKEKWKEKLDADSISLVNAHLDTKICTDLGYNVINSGHE